MILNWSRHQRLTSLKFGSAWSEHFHCLYARQVSGVTVKALPTLNWRYRYRIRFSAKGGQLYAVCLTAVHPSAHSIERVSWASRALCTGDGASSVMKGEWGWGCEWVLRGGGRCLEWENVINIERSLHQHTEAFVLPPTLNCTPHIFMSPLVFHTHSR